MKLKLKIPVASMKADCQKSNLSTDHPQKKYDVTNNSDEQAKDYQNVEVATEKAETPKTQLKLKIKIPVASIKADGQNNKSDGERKDPDKVELPIDKKGPPDCDSDSGSVKIIEFSSHFSPYQSHMERELSEELLLNEKKRKRSAAITNWDWNSVVNLVSSEEDEHSESELSDTVDSTKARFFFSQGYDSQAQPGLQIVG